jgi:hypothetical protein
MISATYSPEDNKLRLYASERLDPETYEKVKAAGFGWAPKQGLFVAPKWTPGREDLCLALAGQIEPEEMTLAERAQMKADRLDQIAANKTRQASAFQRAAADISERFAMGQPILVGHHSERKARKDKERMDSAQSKAVAAHDAASYWLYRAEGVERHANYKNDPRTRARRIETLLAELRDLQRDLNEAYRRLRIWEAAKSDALITHIIGNTGVAPHGVYGDLTSGKITAQEARELCIKAARRTLESDRLARWIAHTLNRLSYERELLGPVARFSGQITPATLQVFLRTHGADKPKAAKVDDDLFTVECEAPLPAHIALGCSVEMTGEEWRDLMQSVGYEVPEPKDAKPPILNFKAPGGTVSLIDPWKMQAVDLPQIELTAAQYAAQGDAKGTRLSSCGGFRVRVGLDYSTGVARYMAPRCAVLIIDQKQHPTPASVLELHSAKEAAE